jgi:hypothetical protein
MYWLALVGTRADSFTVSTMETTRRTLCHRYGNNSMDLHVDTDGQFSAAYCGQQGFKRPFAKRVPVCSAAWSSWLIEMQIGDLHPSLFVQSEPSEAVQCRNRRPAENSPFPKAIRIDGREHRVCPD